MDKKLRDQFEIRRGSPDEDDPYADTFEIYLRGEKVYEWDDNSVINFSEDLIWLRGISELFFDAVSIGLKLAIMDNWMEFLNSKYKVCDLCGNTGIIDTRNSAFTPVGIKVGGLHYCVCPNGRTLKEKGGNMLAGSTLKSLKKR
jgi:hypothetical protein